MAKKKQVESSSALLPPLKQTLRSFSHKSARTARNIRKLADNLEHLASHLPEYIQHFATLTSQQPPKKRLKRTVDPHAPKKPLSNYARFTKDAYKSAKEEFPEANQTELIRVLAEKWRNLPAGEREKYDRKYAEDKAAYTQALKVYAEWKKEGGKTPSYSQAYTPAYTAPFHQDTDDEDQEKFEDAIEYAGETVTNTRENALLSEADVSVVPSSSPPYVPAPLSNVAQPGVPERGEESNCTMPGREDDSVVTLPRSKKSHHSEFGPEKKRRRKLHKKRSMGFNERIGWSIVEKENALDGVLKLINDSAEMGGKRSMDAFQDALER
ncbi:uncharacterized protein VTP21DRAFT_11438 [Calcarisporiella thermophila]|uniref:uncharacterized protein n=1 Tax=Calcarisporiella thermophila TaxID=911321 RepID=UPI003744423C